MSASVLGVIFLMPAPTQGDNTDSNNGLLNYDGTINILGNTDNPGTLNNLGTINLCNAVFTNTGTVNGNSIVPTCSFLVVPEFPIGALAGVLSSIAILGTYVK